MQKPLVLLDISGKGSAIPSVTFYFILEHAPVEDGGAAALVELSCRFLLW